MNKLYIPIAGGVLILGIILGALVNHQQPAEAPQQPILGLAGSAYAINQIDRTTLTNTSTHTNNAQIILPRNNNRKYAIIVNDSSVAVYIHLRNFDSNNAASTTVRNGIGIRLNASGGNYEILPENLYIGDIWIASTTATQTIYVAESS